MGRAYAARDPRGARPARGQASHRQAIVVRNMFAATSQTSLLSMLMLKMLLRRMKLRLTLLPRTLLLMVVATMNMMLLLVDLQLLLAG